jgi:hypothetical protein
MALPIVFLSSTGESLGVFSRFPVQKNLLQVGLILTRSASEVVLCSGPTQNASEVAICSGSRRFPRLRFGFVLRAVCGHGGKLNPTHFEQGGGK